MRWWNGIADAANRSGGQQGSAKRPSSSYCTVKAKGNESQKAVVCIALGRKVWHVPCMFHRILSGEVSGRSDGGGRGRVAAQQST